MGLGDGNAKSGNKGSNWRYEYDVLKALSAIASNTGGGAPSAQTPSLTRATGAGVVTIPSGAKSVTVSNVGTTDATVLGTTVKMGETVSFSATLGNYLGAITYNPLTSTLLIAKLV